MCTCVKLRHLIGASRGAHLPVGMATCRADHRGWLWRGGRMERVDCSISVEMEISVYWEHLALLADWPINEDEPAVICWDWSKRERRQIASECLSVCLHACTSACVLAGGACSCLCVSDSKYESDRLSERACSATLALPTMIHSSFPSSQPPAWSEGSRNTCTALMYKHKKPTHFSAALHLEHTELIWQNTILSPHAHILIHRAYPPLRYMFRSSSEQGGECI